MSLSILAARLCDRQRDLKAGRVTPPYHPWLDLALHHVCLESLVSIRMTASDADKVA